MLVGIVWADAGLRPSRGELVSALRILTGAGVVERIRPGVYQVRRKTFANRESRAAPAISLTLVRAKS